MNKQLREKAWIKYNKHCSYCGKEIEYKDMQVDHIEPQHTGGTDAIENLNPSCRMCNHYKRGMALEHYRETLLTLHERLKKPYINRVGLDYRIVTIEPFDGVFYFERITI